MKSVTQPLIDTPMHRQTIAEMTDDQLEEHLNGLRARRLALVEKYRDQVAAAKAKLGEKVSAELEKQFKKFDDLLVKVDAGLDKLCDVHKKIAALRLMLEDD